MGGILHPFCLAFTLFCLSFPLSIVALSVPPTDVLPSSVSAIDSVSVPISSPSPTPTLVQRTEDPSPTSPTDTSIPTDTQTQTSVPTSPDPDPDPTPTPTPTPTPPPTPTPTPSTPSASPSDPNPSGHRSSSSSEHSFSPSTSVFIPPTSSSVSPVPPSSSASLSAVLIPNTNIATTLNVDSTSFQPPTASVDSPFGSDPTTADTSLPLSSDTAAGGNSGFLHNTPAVVGTFIAVGVVVLVLGIMLISLRRKKSQGIQMESDDDYVINDRSGRTGFASVSYGNPSSDMLERGYDESYDRSYGNRSFGNNDAEHTLGEDIVQQAPFDPFHNTFSYLDASIPSPLAPITAPEHEPKAIFAISDGSDEREDKNPLDPFASEYQSSATRAEPWANQHGVGQYKYQPHPYASEAVRVTPLRRQASERAEYGLAC